MVAVTDSDAAFHTITEVAARRKALQLLGVGARYAVLGDNLQAE